MVRIRSVDNAVVHPMSGTGFPFSLPAAADCCLMFYHHLRFSFSSSESESVAVGWTGTHRCLVSSIIPVKAPALHLHFARKSVGLFFSIGRAFLALSPNPTGFVALRHPLSIVPFFRSNSTPEK